MRILFVFPRCRYPSGQPPLGIASLAASLRRRFPAAGVEVFDATFSKRPERVIEALATKGFDFAAFSLMTTMARDADRLAARLRAVSPRTTIIYGGPHPTVLPEACLGAGQADLVVAGEGELTLEELIARGGDPQGVDGAIYRRGGAVITNPPRQPIEDLDLLPEPERRFFDMETYIRVWNSMDAVSPRLRGTSVIASRGCPHRCSFCQPTLQRMFGREVRRRSPALVATEVANLVRRHGIDAFMFEDDTFLMDKSWAAEVCARLKAAAPGILWCCNLRADPIDEKTLGAMVSAGLRKVNIGIETHSQALLDSVYRKGIRIEQVVESVKLMKRLGLKIQGYFMVGHPSESEEDMLDTIRFASSLDIDEAVFSIVTPFPGTALHAEEASLVDRAPAEFDYYAQCVYSPRAMGVSPERIKRLKRLGYLRFYGTPRRLRAQLAMLTARGGLRKLLYKLRRV